MSSQEISNSNLYTLSESRVYYKDNWFYTVPFKVFGLLQRGEHALAIGENQVCQIIDGVARFEDIERKKDVTYFLGDDFVWGHYDDKHIIVRTESQIYCIPLNCERPRMYKAHMTKDKVPELYVSTRSGIFRVSPSEKHVRFTKEELANTCEIFGPSRTCGQFTIQGSLKIVLLVSIVVLLAYFMHMPDNYRV